MRHWRWFVIVVHTFIWHSSFAKCCSWHDPCLQSLGLALTSVACAASVARVFVAFQCFVQGHFHIRPGLHRSPSADSRVDGDHSSNWVTTAPRLVLIVFTLYCTNFTFLSLFINATDCEWWIQTTPWTVYLPTVMKKSKIKPYCALLIQILWWQFQLLTASLTYT